MTQIHCANPACGKIVAQGSYEWTMEWRLVYCEKPNQSFHSCSPQCSKAIRQHYDEDPKQLKLFPKRIDL